jgi:hypothetical protein
MESVTNNGTYKGYTNLKMIVFDYDKYQNKFYQNKISNWY